MKLFNSPPPPIDGPDIVPGPLEQSGRVGKPVSLLCGTGLESNPMPDIHWRNPNGVLVNDDDNSAYIHINDETGVRLDIGCASLFDFGAWTCTFVLPKSQRKSAIISVVLSRIGC